MLELQVANTRQFCGSLIADTIVAIGDVRDTIDLSVWLKRQSEAYVTIVVALPQGGNLATCVALSSLVEWVNHAAEIAAKDE